MDITELRDLQTQVKSFTDLLNTGWLVDKHPEFRHLIVRSMLSSAPLPAFIPKHRLTTTDPKEIKKAYRGIESILQEYVILKGL